MESVGSIFSTAPCVSKLIGHLSPKCCINVQQIVNSVHTSFIVFLSFTVTLDFSQGFSLSDSGLCLRHLSP
jgi:hypothetical protein